ncbi:class I SAM-dependent methyltransferase [Streptomyces sanglieri]|uniref:Class I SAM-dependent methyltransferase n=1 Tax=Streptomyces sanglieri TaxID=193460 RepID=A0ABW2X8A9_9ACTN
MSETRTAAELDQEASVRRVLEDFYRDGKPPWDSGITPPELVALIEGPGALMPGRALELGCGTGTNAVYLARHSWRVTAVDLVDRAVRQARRRPPRPERTSRCCAATPPDSTRWACPARTTCSST